MKRLVLAFITCFPLLINAQEISSTRFMNDIRYLSSDGLGGRWPGTAGDSLTLLYIKNEFVKAGLKPFGESYFQHFTVVTGTKPGKNNLFVYNGDTIKPSEEFIPLSFTLDTTVTADICFAAYGIDDKSYSDFKKTDLKNKWVIIKYDVSDEVLQKVKNALTLRARARNASEKGAAGVIFVHEGKGSFPDNFLEKPSGVFKIPVIAVKETVFSRVLSNSDYEILKSEYGLKNRAKQFSGKYQFCITADIAGIEVQTANVIGYIPGTDSLLRNEYIVIGGHHDHLGWGGPGSGSRKPEMKDIHHGADDNASGTAGIMELARWYSTHPQKRTLIFSAFAAEEQGLLGSKQFVNNPPVITGTVLLSPLPLSSISAMVNFDMIGRMKPDKKTLDIAGGGSSAEGDSILKLYEDTTLFKLKISSAAGGGSDHASFYRKNIPVFFLITGIHDDYHTPSDTWEKIDSAGMANVLQFAVKVINDISDRPQKLTFREAEQKQGSENRHGGGKTLGIIPDISDSSGKGLRVEGVRKEGPADKGGIKKEDMIVSVNGQKVTCIQDYMTSLSTLKDGSRVTVEVIRMENGMEKKLKLKIQL